MTAPATANAIVLVAIERLRQIHEEGWTPEHDDSHDHGELAMAAAEYAIPERFRSFSIWPWDEDAWKPTPNDRIRELVKAGALILAEIERLERAE